MSRAFALIVLLAACGAPAPVPAKPAPANQIPEPAPKPAPEGMWIMSRGELSDRLSADAADPPRARVVMLFAWGWCLPCQEVWRHLDERYADAADVDVYGLIFDENGDARVDADAMAADGLRLPVLLDRDGSAIRPWFPDASVVPSALVIDAKGDVVARFDQWPAGAEQQLYDAISAIP